MRRLTFLLVVVFLLTAAPASAQTVSPTSGRDVVRDLHMEAQMCKIVTDLAHNDTRAAVKFALDFVEQYKEKYKATFIAYRTEDGHSGKELSFQWLDGALDKSYSSKGEPPTELPAWAYSVNTAVVNEIGDWKSYFAGRRELLYTESGDTPREYDWYGGETISVIINNEFENIDCPSLSTAMAKPENR